ncbi:ABC transporter ATP-binding protein [Microvirga puerhi]|uniref:ABC transporter ATP-binding protein n=1 Tax=Microvirga puerhi TaxID=2876078 RepID=A0ABS7VIJ8_9HYPH|nr:ABC transporter ATP-binding protein [Microvirga puerhi]MBZ6074842.1 ABC transporter ATP-binding protein [Microvirga puerhi]
MLGVVVRDVTVCVRGLAEPVIDLPSLSIAAGEKVAVTGPSGAGKTTLINVLTGLERPSKGQVLWSGTDIARLSEAQRDAWRARHVGIVFQDFHLFSGLSVRDNVLLPQQLRSFRLPPGSRERAESLLRRVGIERHDQRVETLSRGEMQRVAIARALQQEPGILVADEPTASLDTESAKGVISLLIDLSASLGTTLIVVTHDGNLAQAMDRTICLDRGRLVMPAARAA